MTQEPDIRVSEPQLRRWLMEQVLAQLAPGAAAEIASDAPLTEYGLDSVRALSLITRIEDHWGLVLDSSVVWEHPTIDDLVGLLLSELR